MIIKKGQLLFVESRRKGNYKAIAIRDFDTEKDEFYPVAVAQEEPVRGLANIWYKGEAIPCSKSLVDLSLIERISHEHKT